MGVCSCTTTRPQAVVKSEVDGSAVVQGNVGTLTPAEEDFSRALAHYASGILYHDKGENIAAIESWVEVARLDPSRLELRTRIIQEFLRQGQYKKAVEILEVATRQDPNSVASWVLLAIACRCDKQWEKAVHAAEQAVRLDRTKFPPYEELFAVAVQTADLNKARKVLDRAARQKSDDFRFWLRLADLYVVLESKAPGLGVKREEIIRYYDKAVQLKPDESGVLAHVAEYHMLSQNFAKAIELFQKILVDQPNAENVRASLARAYSKQGDQKRAIEVYEQIVKNEPYRYQIYLQIAELYEEMKDWPRAMTNYHLSLSANANQLYPYLRMVLIELKNKQTDAALKTLEIAREKFPNTPQVSYFYGLAYSASKEYGRALQSIEEAEKLAQKYNPDMLNAGFYFYYGSALERSGQFDSAVEKLVKSLEIDPDYAEACNYLGFMYADKNVKLDEAMKLIERALAYEPDNGAFLDSLGWVYYRKGKLDKSLEYLLRAVKAMGSDATIFEHLGDVYRQMGKVAEAIEYYQKAVELDPDQKGSKGKLDAVRNASPGTNPSAKKKAAGSPPVSH